MTTRKSSSTKHQEQLNHISIIVESLDSKLQTSKRTYLEKLTLLESVSLGLYEELDKLCKKAPAEKLTDLILANLNDIIKETKELAEEDPYIQRLTVFVAAGDNPEQRDALVVLRQIRQGLERHRKKLELERSETRELLAEAKCIQIALIRLIEGDKDLQKSDLSRYGIRLVPEKWFYDAYPNAFDYQLLAKIDIPTYFKIAEEQ